MFKKWKILSVLWKSMGVLIDFNLNNWIDLILKLGSKKVKVPLHNNLQNLHCVVSYV